eukprot:tig00021433_g21274.t1
MSVSPSTFLVVNIISAEAPEKRKRLIGSRRCRYFVVCQYGSDSRNAIRTATLPGGPNIPYNQSFRLQLDGFSSTVQVTLMRERKNKEAVAMGGIKFNIDTNLDKATAVEKTYSVSPGCSLRVAFQPEVPPKPEPAAEVYSYPEVAVPTAVLPADPEAYSNSETPRGVSRSNSFDQFQPPQQFDFSSPISYAQQTTQEDEPPRPPCYAGMLSFLTSGCEAPVAKAQDYNVESTSWRYIDSKPQGWRSAWGLWDVEL